MKIENAKWFDQRIHATIDGLNLSVPQDDRNIHYQEIMRLVEAGELVIEPQDV